MTPTASQVWAFEQFPIDIDRAGLTKSALYRGPVTCAAVTATLTAIARIEEAALTSAHDFAGATKSYEHFGLGIHSVTCSPLLKPQQEYARLSVTAQMPFQGGKVQHRPLLRAADREFDLSRHTARQISRRIRSGDSQPGVLSKVFGRSLYLYGGIVDEAIGDDGELYVQVGQARLLAIRSGAVCLATCDGKSIWVTHVRRPKTKMDTSLFPKVPAVFGLFQLGLMQRVQVGELQSSNHAGRVPQKNSTFQEVWVDMDHDEHGNKLAYIHFEFYNGAMSTEQCSRLIEMMDDVLDQHTPEDPIRAVVLMGGSYFSNGIALNIIEASDDPAAESWMNINRIDDVVDYILHRLPTQGILTVAAMRGNAAAGGVALATACDFVIAGSDIVLNPAYRGVGLHGSEYHTLSYHGRCGEANATKLLRSMLPMSPLQAQAMGLVDFVFPSGEELDNSIRFHVALLAKNRDLTRGPWKKNVDLTPASLARTRAHELSEMSKDFWSARSTRYHSRRHDFVRKVKADQTPLRFATHRRLQHGVQYDEEELDSFDDVAYYEALARRRAAEAVRNDVRKELGSLITRWAETEAIARSHRRGSVVLQAEQEMAHVALPGAERKTETVFSCYYKPVDAPLTPPDSPLSPMHERQTAVLGA